MILTQCNLLKFYLVILLSQIFFLKISNSLSSSECLNAPTAVAAFGDRRHFVSVTFCDIKEAILMRFRVSTSDGKDRREI